MISDSDKLLYALLYFKRYKLWESRLIRHKRCGNILIPSGFVGDPMHEGKYYCRECGIEIYEPDIYKKDYIEILYDSVKEYEDLRKKMIG